MTAQTGSVWTTVLLTVERYVAICYPLKARVLFTYSHTRLYVVGVILFCVSYNIPRFLETEVITFVFCSSGAIGKEARPSDLRNNRVFYKAYYIWTYLVIMYVLPFLTLAILNTFVAFAVRRARKMRERLARSQEREFTLATMLFCIVAIFFSCKIFPLLVNVLELFHIDVLSLTTVSNLLVTVNSSSNFIVYFIYGKNFRYHFLKTFCSSKVRRQWSVSRKVHETVYRISGSSRSYTPNKNGKRIFITFIDHTITTLIDHTITILIDHTITTLIDHTITTLIDHTITTLIDHTLFCGLEFRLFKALQHGLGQSTKETQLGLL
ncbi:FMRFamide receptor-like [Tachypleus tridentatus]|uniref:FMRFamide receptor-like n=1 Tax=Tachypleus tridentatus TaxID=6853 RepID=UPI003FD11978